MQLTTDLDPYALLSELKAAEERLGRVYTRRWGPRQIDLDILLYDDMDLRSDTLSIPHISMHEREFVLRPLCEYVHSYNVNPCTYDMCYNAKYLYMHACGGIERHWELYMYSNV